MDGTDPTMSSESPGSGAASPGVPSAPRASRTGPLLLGALIGVLVTIIVVLVVVVVRNGGNDAATTTSTTTSSSTTSTSTSLTPAATNGDLRGVVARLDVMLEESGRARQDVTTVIGEASTGCTLDPSTGIEPLSTASQSRQQLIGQLSALQVTGNQQADQVVALLLRAMQDSQHATQHYLDWIWTSYSKYYYDNQDPQTGKANCPGSAPKTPDWDQAVAASGDATTAKQAFVAAYNPIATQLGLRTWADTAF